VIQPGYVTLDFLNRFPNIFDKKRRCLPTAMASAASAFVYLKR
jgi:hypothetical protein